MGTCSQRTHRDRDDELRFAVKNPTLWWPNGYGEPYLYDLRVNAQHATGTSSISHRLGFRRVELVQDDTSAGGTPGKTFYFKVNSVPIFIKGANWIPSDSFPTRVNKTITTHLLRSAQAANMNMVGAVRCTAIHWKEMILITYSPGYDPYRWYRFASGVEGDTSRTTSTQSAIDWGFLSGKNSCLPVACKSLLMSDGVVYCCCWIID